ncbi:FAD-binding oxidoreductase [Hydrogenovibrio sp. 3SP14C1]|uniref:FAD-binding oxidoreductase n=1 Tax=Hydrogenovibrio sp. 3SP14C1 TaxID=3038774 RepID=UPI0024174356|nr:FAD-binding oxidoreductase [Hydrogenovibrio sp. 3SP14C1]MDG4811486.1 FAD-binding oxidoreductase [Hydrogenovibrio sp. 3SP14C1]
MFQTALQPMTVEQTEKLTENTLLLLLRPSKEFIYHGGQYVMLGLVPTDLKPFSIASSSRTDGLIELHIRNQDNSQWMQDLFALQPGTNVYIDGPNNQYELDPIETLKKHTIILVAGGTGFAPMKALLDELLQQKEADALSIEFYWGARSDEDLYLNQDMQKLAESHPNIRYISSVSGDFAEHPDQRGIHHKVLQDHSDLSQARVYLCGPWPMVESAKASFVEAGLAPDAFN